MSTPVLNAPAQQSAAASYRLIQSVLLTGSLLVLSSCNNSDTDTASVSDPGSMASNTLNINDMPLQALDAANSTYQDLGGRGFELDSFAGQKVFVNHWATWCAPCIRELPALAAAAEALQDEGYLFLLASDESIETIQEFIAEREFSGNFIKLNKFFGAWGIDAVPSSSLYNEQGELLRTWAGEYDWASDEMLDHIRQASVE